MANLLAEILRRKREDVAELLRSRTQDCVRNHALRVREKGEPNRLRKTLTAKSPVLKIIADGYSNKEVANLLNLSVYTVETHRTHILQKLNLHSVPELILYAVRKGIIS